jgi:hypothetical protein
MWVDLSSFSSLRGDSFLDGQQKLWGFGSIDEKFINEVRARLDDMAPLTKSGR